MYYVGIDVGGTNLKAGLVDEAGHILRVCREPLQFTDAPALAATLAGLARRVMEGRSPREIGWVGIGIPGAVEGGTVLFTANIPMENIPLVQLFRRHLDLPVFLANDADCAAAAEYLFGCGKGARDFVIVTLGTGVGGGIILNGRLHTGKCCAGEIGHMVLEHNGWPCSCGRRGCWESYCSASGLERMARDALARHPDSILKGRPLDGETLFSAAGQQDPAALEAVETYGSYLACGLTSLVNILQPDVIAIGGGLAAAPAPLLLDPVAEAVHRDCYGRFVGHYPLVTRAAMGNDAGIVGAALIGRLCDPREP